jgi:molybdopterin converting factor small subunit
MEAQEMIQQQIELALESHPEGMTPFEIIKAAVPLLAEESIIPQHFAVRVDGKSISDWNTRIMIGHKVDIIPQFAGG